MVNYIQNAGFLIGVMFKDSLFLIIWSFWFGGDITDSPGDQQSGNFKKEVGESFYHNIYVRCISLYGESIFYNYKKETGWYVHSFFLPPGVCLYIKIYVIVM